ncbi:MAG: hypothetical protein JJ956_12575, partial [Pseudomonadales bacterium]|nr:hypothetical protein [Pseudomonadales bacterium]
MAGKSKSNAGAPLAHREALKDKFGSRSAVVGVVGLGYVGLPLGLAFAETDYQVIGFDIDSAKIEAIENAQSYFNHI